MTERPFDLGAMVAAQAIIPPDRRIGDLESRECQADAIDAGLNATSLRPKARSNQRASALGIIRSHRLRPLDNG